MMVAAPLAARRSKRRRLHATMPFRRRLGAIVGVWRGAARAQGWRRRALHYRLHRRSMTRTLANLAAPGWRCVPWVNPRGAIADARVRHRGIVLAAVRHSPRPAAGTDQRPGSRNSSTTRGVLPGAAAWNPLRKRPRTLGQRAARRTSGTSAKSRGRSRERRSDHFRSVATPRRRTPEPKARQRSPASSRWGGSGSIQISTVSTAYQRALRRIEGTAQ